MSRRLPLTLFILGILFALSGLAQADNGSKDGLNPISFGNPNALFQNDVTDARPVQPSFKKPEGAIREAQMSGVAPTPPSSYFCDNQYYYDDTVTSVWVWSNPDTYGDDLFNMRFTVEEGIQCTLKVGWILMYGGYMTGTPDMRIYLWDDNGFGFPGNKLDSVDIPYSELPTAFGWVGAEWTSGPWVFSYPNTEYHIGWTTLGGDGDTLYCVSDKGTGPHSYTGEERANEYFSGSWGSMYNDWSEDVCFLIESEVCCQELPASDCYSQSWHESAAYYWPSPHPTIYIINYAQRFTVNGIETLSSVELPVYDMGTTPPYVSGNDDLIIKVWSDNGVGYPGAVLATEIIPAGTYPFFPAYANIDFFSHGLVFQSEDFFVSFNSTGSFPNDCEATLSDDETDGHNRSYCFYNDQWWIIGDLFGYDVDMLYRANLCIDVIDICDRYYYYTGAEYYWSLPDEFGDAAHAQRMQTVGSQCRVEEVSWALYLPDSDSLNNPYTHDSKVSIYSDVGGLPGTELASITLTPADYVMLPGWTTVNFEPQNVLIQGYYWIAIESYAPTPEEGIRTMSDFGGGVMFWGGANLWNGMWGLVCDEWSGIPCDLAFLARSRLCCDIPPPTQCYGDPSWSTAQHDQQRTGASPNSLGDAQCDLTVDWCYVHPTNSIWYTGPAIVDNKVVCAFDNEIKVFYLLSGSVAYTLSGFPLGNQIRSTPHITTVDVIGVPTQVMYVAGGDQQSVSCWDFNTGSLLWSRDISTMGVEGVFGQTRYCSFITLDINGEDILFWGTDDGMIVAAHAATGALYAGWSTNPVSLGQAVGKSGSTDGISLFYNSHPGGATEGDVWSIDAATGAINWQLSSTDGLQANTVFPEGPQVGEGFPGGNSVDFEVGVIYVNSDIAAPYFPGDGVFYAINIADGSIKYAVPSVGARSQSAGGTPVIDASRVYVVGESSWANPVYGGRVVAFQKHSGAAVWAFDSPEYNNYWGDAALTCEEQGEPNHLWVAGHHGFIDCLNSSTGESIFRRRVSFGSYPSSVALSFAIGQDRIAVSDFYGGLYVLEKGEDRPRLEIQSYQPQASVEFGEATSLHVPLEKLLANTGCANLTINDITIDEDYSHPFIPNFVAQAVRPDVMDRASEIADRLTRGFSSKAMVWKAEPTVDDYFVKSDRDRQLLNLGANTIPEFIQTGAGYPDGVVSPADGEWIQPGDTVDVVIDVNQSMIHRGPQRFYMTFDTDDPDFFLHQNCELPYGPPEVGVTLVGGCLIDTTTLHFGPGAANTQLVTNTGRIATGDWDPHGFDIDGDAASVYQGSFIYAVSEWSWALNTQAWHGGGETESYISMQPDPNWCDNECKAHLDENTQLSCLGGYSTDGLTYEPIFGNRVCKSYIDSVQDFWPWGQFPWPAWPWYDAEFSNELTMGLYVNSRTVGAVGFAPLKDLTVEIFEITERNGDSVTGWKFGATMDYDVGGDIAARDPEGSAAWVSTGGAGDVAWGMMKFPFGCGSNAPNGNNNSNVDYIPLINSVQMYGYAAWWGDIYLGDTAWKYLNMPAGLYSQDPAAGGDEEAHFTIAGHDFTGGDTYEMAVAQFGLHGTSGDATEIVALAKLANKWLGFGRGDVNNDGVIDLADIVYLAKFVNGNGPGPVPFMHLGDVDCDGAVDMDDVIYLAEYLYNNGLCPCGDWCF